MKKKIAVILGDPNLSDKVKLGGKFNPEDIEVVDRLKQALASIKEYKFDYYSNHNNLIRDLQKNAKKYHLALNLCDEGFFNDPKQEAVIPIILENIVNIPYTGAGPECLYKCYDKANVKERAIYHKIPTPEFIVIGNDQEIILPPFDFPVFVKPNKGDGSVGINENSKVNDKESFYNQIKWLREKLGYLGHKSDILIEKFLAGKEMTAAIIGNKPNLEIRLLEEAFEQKSGLPNYQIHDEKWNPNSREWKEERCIRPTIPVHRQDSIIKWSKYLFNLLECRDYARFDWRLDERGTPNFIEANPNPGWCWDGHLVKAFSLEEGFSPEIYSSILNKIIETAEKRYPR